MIAHTSFPKDNASSDIIKFLFRLAPAKAVKKILKAYCFYYV